MHTQDVSLLVSDYQKQVRQKPYQLQGNEVEPPSQINTCTHTHTQRKSRRPDRRVIARATVRRECLLHWGMLANNMSEFALKREASHARQRTWPTSAMQEAHALHVPKTKHTHTHKHIQGLFTTGTPTHTCWQNDGCKHMLQSRSPWHAHMITGIQTKWTSTNTCLKFI